ncbi:hypothetical protein B0H67DRAFT_604614 [Lasiosphaeris hirsuta]|uniref:Uncharacterized protein n=1 Tax=Lasiosphaeris hirsuta TaxID=260670 RepID=A0AA39ZRJ2_9PEZI|nr:hypothetical protein B0H67DRAFT_604614 [Lasiosphaeris hirsuta]
MSTNDAPPTRIMQRPCLESSRLMDQGRAHLGARRLELSLQRFTMALHLCESHPHLAGYKYQVLEMLRQALDLMDEMVEPLTRPRVHIVGEMGTVVRQLGRLDEAKEAFTEQYALAKQLQMEHVMCRAISNMGIVNYQQALKILEEEPKTALREKVATDRIHLAVEQLAQGVELAKNSKNVEAEASFRESTTRYQQVIAWESIGYSRLSLCYTALASLDAIDTARDLGGSILPMSCFFHGRVLLLQGKTKLALEQFNSGPRKDGELGVTTPTMAMCKEPSAENRGYLCEIIGAGADLSMSDSDGYTALDHAVSSGNSEAEALVLKGLETQLSLSRSELESLQKEARLRKGYREILQEKLRPILYQRDKHIDCIKELRRAYADILSADPEEKAMFDNLKFVKYTDFQSLNTLDDTSHTQYRRMLGAIELLLQANPAIDVQKLCIWMDFACVGQDSPGIGVSALPFIITQCDAVISLVDDAYYDRAWCCVEAMMISQLQRPTSRHPIHRWYEHIPLKAKHNAENTTKWGLHRARGMSLIMFLERQSRLLGEVIS